MNQKRPVKFKKDLYKSKETCINPKTQQQHQHQRMLLLDLLICTGLF